MKHGDLPAAWWVTAAPLNPDHAAIIRRSIQRIRSSVAARGASLDEFVDDLIEAALTEASLQLHRIGMSLPKAIDTILACQRSRAGGRRRAQDLLALHRRPNSISFAA